MITLLSDEKLVQAHNNHEQSSPPAYNTLFVARFPAPRLSLSPSPTATSLEPASECDCPLVHTGPCGSHTSPRRCAQPVARRRSLESTSSSSSEGANQPKANEPLSINDAPLSPLSHTHIHRALLSHHRHPSSPHPRHRTQTQTRSRTQPKPAPALTTPTPPQTPSHSSKKRKSSTRRAVLAIVLPPLAVMGVVIVASGIVLCGGGKLLASVVRRVAAGPKAGQAHRSTNRIRPDERILVMRGE